MTITVLAVAAAILTPLLSYLGVVRRLSGKVRTTDASKLWDASEKMREELGERNEFLRNRLDKCDERIDGLEDMVRDLIRRNEELSHENGVLDKLVHAHEETITRLEAENKTLKARIAQLEAVHGT